MRMVLKLQSSPVTLPPARPHLLSLTKQCHQVEPNTNTWVCGGQSQWFCGFFFFFFFWSRIILLMYVGKASLWGPYTTVFLCKYMYTKQCQGGANTSPPDINSSESSHQFRNMCLQGRESVESAPFILLTSGYMAFWIYIHSRLFFFSFLGKDWT